MIYPNLKFPKPHHRPFFYTNFVQTLDGKVSVKKEGYWPIGSKKDYQVLVELRAYADCLIHGGNLAREFGDRTIESIHKESFKKLRRKLGRNGQLPYYIVTKHPESFHTPVVKLTHSPGALAGFLHKKGYKYVLVEGGPTLLGSFLKEDLIDEIFLTIVPKIIGSDKNSTLNLAEGQLFPPEQIKHLKLLSVKKFKDELFLRYSLT